MKPNFFIIGAPKAGTSSLGAYLSEHPQIFFSKIKEPFFWDDDFSCADHEFRPHDISSYLKLFTSAESHHIAVGEGSTRYLRSKNAVKNILDYNSEAKFIVMLRNPIEAVQAYHMEMKYSLQENVEIFEEAWCLQEQRKAGFCVPQTCSEPLVLQYGYFFKYAEQLEYLYTFVSPDKIKVIIYDDFVKDTQSVYIETLSFLGLEYDSRVDFPVFNSSHDHRYKLLSLIILSPPKNLAPLVRLIRGWFIDNRFPIVEALKRKLNTQVKRRKVSDEMRSELVEYFRKDIVRLSSILHCNLTHWLK